MNDNTTKDTPTSPAMKSLADDMNEMLVRHVTAGGLSADLALSVAIAVIADQFRFMYGDDQLEVLCRLVMDRARFPLAQRSVN